jgi:N-methylhydantoinase A
MAGKRLAIDVGGTFVDFVLLDEASGAISIEKGASNIKSLTERFFGGMRGLGVEAGELSMIIHGSTVVLNTILQEKGASLGLITSAGFRDVLELGRGSRPEVYNLLYKPTPPLIPRYLRLEAPERVDRYGQVVRPLDEAATRRAAEQLKGRGVAGIAVCFLHAYANPSHERRARELIREVYPEAFVAISSDITGEYREFERTSTVALNVYVMPRMADYLGDIEAHLEAGGYQGVLNVMQSTGGMMPSSLMRDVPIRTLESGPAGGVIGAVALGQHIGEPNLIAADVGGTSFDVALIYQGQPLEKAEVYVNKRPVLQPSIDIESIGAGGGSIAWIDDEGGLRVGPRSAEADPGPVCFGRGGSEPTVTDAHLVLGHINPDFFLGHRMQIDVAAARDAIEQKVAAPLGLTLEQAADGIVRLADTNMINAISRLTVERGYDPRDFALLGYGGGGGLFAGALAEELEIPRAIIPPYPSVFSAWGILNADYREDVVRTFVVALADLTPDALLAQFAALEEASLAQMRVGGVDTTGVSFSQAVDMRYQGQEHSVRVPLPEAATLQAEGLDWLARRFDRLHEQTYAHATPGLPTELVNLRLSAVRPLQKPSIPLIATGDGSAAPALKGRRPVFFRQLGGYSYCPIYDREGLRAGDRLAGPAIVEEWSTTVIVFPNQQLEVDRFGNLVIHSA